MRVKDYRFIKPVEHALIDLLNKSYSTDFRYAELEILAIDPIISTQTTSISTPPNTRAQIKFVPMGENVRGTRWYNYRRITLSSFITSSFRFMSEDVLTDELFIETMLSRFLLNVDLDYFVWTVETNSSGNRVYTITVADHNPVWIGSVAIVCINNTQLAAIDRVNEGVLDDDETPPDPDPENPITNSILGGEYTFTQSTLADAWYIEHNLECYPTVTVIDDTGDDIIGSITYLSKDILQVVFNTPMSGIAILR